MFHQWYNLKEYGDKEKALISSIKALGGEGPKGSLYGEQDNYDEKMANLKAAFQEYVEYCEAGHKKQMHIDQDENF